MVAMNTADCDATVINRPNFNWFWICEEEELKIVARTGSFTKDFNNGPPNLFTHLK
jgi:hypothetical protein